MFGPYNQQRQKYILSEIKKNQSVKIKELAKILNVTERTIRRDIKELELTGMIRPRYGGAVLLSTKESALYKNNQPYLHTNMKINSFDMTVLSPENTGKVFVLGSFNTDLVYRLQNFPCSGETTRALYSCCLPGGKGSNQAIAACMAGARTDFVAKVGNDDFAAKAQQFLNNLGFEALTLFTQPETPTGSAVVMVSEETGDNAIIINPGANQTFTADEIISCYGAIKKSNVFLTQMENNPDATALALKFAHSCGITTIFNPAPWREEVRDMLPWVSIATPNLTEAESITATSIRTNEEILRAAEAIHQMGPQIVIITLGSKGCWFYDGKQHRQVPAYPAVNIDTAGAGDAFNGALAAQLACGLSLSTALNYATAFASLAVEREGAANMPEHHFVIEKIKNSVS